MQITLRHWDRFGGRRQFWRLQLPPRWTNSIGPVKTSSTTRHERQLISTSGAQHDVGRARVKQCVYSSVNYKYQNGGGRWMKENEGHQLTSLEKEREHRPEHSRDYFRINGIVASQTRVASLDGSRSFRLQNAPIKHSSGTPMGGSMRKNHRERLGGTRHAMWPAWSTEEPVLSVPKASLSIRKLPKTREVGCAQSFQ